MRNVNHPEALFQILNCFIILTDFLLSLEKEGVFAHKFRKFT